MSIAERLIRLSLPLFRLFLLGLPIHASRFIQQLGAARIALAKGVRREVVQANSLRCEWLIPEHPQPTAVLLYLHGGGFVYGLYAAHRWMASYLAKSANIRTLAVDYRLAPEHPFPAALDDVLAAYRWLLTEGIAPHQIVVGGDSAGGTLTVALLLKLRDMGEPLPAAGFCLSPALDMEGTGETFHSKADPLMRAKGARAMLRHYIGNADVHNPYLAPIHGDLTGFPPLLIQVGGDEILRSDAERLAALSAKAGVPATLQIYPRMWHVWQLFVPFMPEAKDACDKIARFINSHLGV